MSIFRRKKKSLDPQRQETRSYNLADLDRLPKTDPGYRTASATMAEASELLDKQIEEKRAIQRSARKITERVQQMDLRWDLSRPKKA